MPGILAIDQARVSGWAFCLPGCEPLWGEETAAKSGAWEGRKFLGFRKIVIDKIEKLDPAALAFEAPFTPRKPGTPGSPVLSVRQQRGGYGYSSHVTAIAEEYNLACEEIGAQEAAKFVTDVWQFPGDTPDERREAKYAALRVAFAARGWAVCSPNAMCALAVLLVAEKRLYPRESRSRRMVLKAPTGPLFEGVLHG